jgi:para-aminobenzoate synthetase / 4-amino-4-deoxychorismate lyase
MVREVCAIALDEVVPALREVAAAVESGFHAAGFVTYEAGAGIEPHFAARSPREGLPLLWFGIFTERREGEPTIPALDANRAGEAFRVGPLTPSVTEEQYMEAVARIRGWIAAGDSYQVNHTFRLRGTLHGSEEALYAHLCRAQRSAYCAHITLPRYSILSASPELFFRLRGDRIELRPMKGTRPRGRWSAEDEARAAELLDSPKDRAENLMIVDLLRNDVGRIARFGSVNVPRLFEIERYPTVHQMTSTITATLRPDVSLDAIFAALFPSGSVTGAPKIRTSEIIRELEDSPRGPYTGAIGFASPGESVFSVAIRTALLDRETGALELGVGSGITWDSDPRAELRECMEKGAFMTHVSGDFRLLESLRLQQPGGYDLLEGHLRRLTASGRYFAFAVDPAAVRSELLAIADATGDGLWKVRLLVDRTGRLEHTVEPIPETQPPAVVTIAREPVDEANPFLYHKTTERGVYDRLRSAHPDVDDVLLVNRRGELTEATTANLVLEIGGEFVTPPVSAGLLPGVLRERLIRDGWIREAVLAPDDVWRARRIYLLNSVRGWREAVLQET